MGLPGQRRSSSHKRRRAAHFALKPQTFVACSNCKKKIKPHTMCPHCGHYQGRKVMTTRLEQRLQKQSRRSKREKADNKE